MGPDDQVVVIRLDLDVIDGHGGQPVHEGLPARATVGRDVEAHLVPDEEEVLLVGVLGKDVHGRSGKPGDQWAPRRSEVLAGIDVRSEVARVVPVESGVNTAFTGVGGHEATDVRVLGKTCDVRCQIRPRRAAVPGAHDPAVVAPRVEHVPVHGRFTHGRERAVRGHPVVTGQHGVRG